MPGVEGGNGSDEDSLRDARDSFWRSRFSGVNDL